MPAPKIHQVVRRPGIGGQPRKYPGVFSGGYQYASGTVQGDGVMVGQNPANIVHGIANNWSFVCWYMNNNASQTATEVIFDMVNTANSNNRILIQILGATANDPLNVFITDSAGATIKDYQYNSQTNTASELRMFGVTWDGTTLKYYRDGRLTAADTLTTDTTGTMTNTGRGVSIYNTVAGATPHNGAHKMAAMWNATLSANEMISLWNQGFGTQANLNENFEDYASKNSLVHWWRPGLSCASVGAFGLDYATGTAAVPTNAVIVTTLTTAAAAQFATGQPRGIHFGGIDLDGSAEQLRNTTDQLIGIGNQMTWVFWVRNLGTTSQGRILSVRPTGSTAGEIHFNYRGDLANDPLQVLVQSDADTTIKDYRWNRFFNHVEDATSINSTMGAWSWDGPGNIMKGYRNGQLIEPDTKTTDVNSSSRTDAPCQVNIGSSSTPALRFTGHMLYIACWNTILTPGEIKTIWNEGWPSVDLSKNTLGYYSADNLKHWWKLGSPPGSIGAGTTYTVDCVKSGGINVETNATNISDLDVFNATSVQPLGHSVRFNGTDQFMINRTLNQIGIANAWTVHIWARTEQITSNQDMLNIGNAANAIRIRFVDAATDRVDVTLNDSSNTLFKDFRYNLILTNAGWRVFTITWDGSTLQAYRLGTAVAATSSPTNNAGVMTDTGRAVAVGATLDTPPINCFTGRFNEVAIWNSALSATEIRQLHNGLFPGSADLTTNIGAYVSAANLQHWWKLTADPYGWGKDYKGNIELVGPDSLYSPSGHANTGYGQDL